MTPVPNDLLVELKDIFAERFNNDDLADFALELGVDYENLAGTTRKAKARELATYLGRHRLLDKLAVVGPEERPDIPWEEILGRYGFGSLPTAPLSMAATLPAADLQALVPILADRPMFLTPEGRRSVLILAGVDRLTAADVNGSARTTAAAVLTSLNAFGRTPEGDTAIGRLLAFLVQDTTLPPSDLSVVESIRARAL